MYLFGSYYSQTEPACRNPRRFTRPSLPEHDGVDPVGVALVAIPAYCNSIHGAYPTLPERILKRFH